MDKFTITDEMRARANEPQNKRYIESGYLDDLDYIGVQFCNHFNTAWNFDTWGGEDDPMLMYVASVHWLTVVVEGDGWRDTVDEFLDFISDNENYIIDLRKRVLVQRD